MIIITTTITVNTYLAHTRWASLVAQTVKNLPAMQETRVQSLSREDPLEKEMAPDSSTLAWKIPWTEKPTVHGVAKSQTRLSDFTSRSGRAVCFKFLRHQEP